MLLPVAPTGTYAGDWGTGLRAKAFPDGFPPTRPLDPAQLALLRLIAERCFGPAAEWGSDEDSRRALRDLIPE
ncbi:hypothetical protein [Dactylosporangium sp. NPDC051541]|uniref:hypothetical protein n=1 Tax=Dactylosporangium sp. NPDC051541 TaxID=3363977 RepID=UPI0037A33B90